MPIIKTFPSGPFDTNAYVVACKSTRKAVLIDPAPSSAKELLAYIKEHHLTVEKILLTHSHWDHIGDSALLKKTLGAEVWVHEADAANLRQPGSDGLPQWVTIDAVEPSGYLTDGMVIPVGDLQLQVIHTPGHSPGGVCFFEPVSRTLFSGDTLFKGTIGNLQLPTAHAAHMWPTLRKLAALPPETRVLPGHGSSTTIGAEPWLADAEKRFGGPSRK